MEWYYAINDQRQGPIPESELAQLAASGVVKPETLVWRQGMANWQPYSTVGIAAGGTPPLAGDDTEVCVVSGKRYPKREMIQYEGKWISAEHRDEYFQRMREGAPLPGQGTVPGPYGYGGFWQRFVARIVDGFALMIPNLLLGLILGVGWGGRLMGKTPDAANVGAFFLMQAIFQVTSVAIAIAYEIFFIRKFDATPGKMAMGLKLLRADGGKLSVGRIIGRYFAYLVSGIILCIGFIIAAFDDEKRSLHDRICDTRVIKTR
jgi:uncharacterized RDD family membrane protein YckC